MFKKFIEKTWSKGIKRAIHRLKENKEYTWRRKKETVSVRVRERERE